MSPNYTGDSKIRFASIVTTYRCNARCNMCDIWKHPTHPQSEVGVETYSKLPHIDSINVTGGEPFLRADLEEIVAVLLTKSPRVVISTNGWFVDRTIRLFEKYPHKLGLRVSIEGLAKANDEIRGMRNGFDHALRILTRLHEKGEKDIGFGLTLQQHNAEDGKALYELAKMMGMEFATAALHNTAYFHKLSNAYDDPTPVLETLRAVTDDLLRSRRPKDWFRAYFNYGLMNYIQGHPRLLPCQMAHDAFFLEPNGDVVPCNGMEAQMVFGNLTRQSWDELWMSPEAEYVRAHVRSCPRQCWMMGSVGQEMKKNLHVPVAWIAKHKLLRRELRTPERAANHPHRLFGAGATSTRVSMRLSQGGEKAHAPRRPEEPGGERELARP